MTRPLSFFYVFLLFHFVACAPPPPEQFHLAFTADPSEMWVSWARVGNISSLHPFCSYGTQSGHLSQRVSAEVLTYKDGSCTFAGCEPWSGLAYTARLTSLPPATRIFYRCGDDDAAGGLGAEFSFTSRPRRDSNKPFALVALGDIGSSPEALAVRDDILAAMRASYTSPSPLSLPLALMLQIGDISYANGNQSMWDVYGRAWEPILSTVPTLVSPGNHDGEWTFGNSYDSPSQGGGDSGVAFAVRYPGPGEVISFTSPHTGAMNSTSFWWSVDYETVHIAAVSGVHDFEPGSPQYQWLEQDLKAAAAPDSRKQRPWLIVTCHYPLYCTLDDCFCNYTSGATCRSSGASSAFGTDVLDITANRMRLALEPLLHKYSVDLVITGHEHTYERTLPVYNLTVYEGVKTPVTAERTRQNKQQGLHARFGDKYVRPEAPVHVMVGTGGSDPDMIWQPRGKYAWSAVRTDDDVTHKAPWGWVRVDAQRDQIDVQFVNLRSANRLFDHFSIFK